MGVCSSSSLVTSALLLLLCSLLFLWVGAVSLSSSSFSCMHQNSFLFSLPISRIFFPLLFQRKRNWSQTEEREKNIFLSFWQLDRQKRERETKSFFRCGGGERRRRITENKGEVFRFRRKEKRRRKVFSSYFCEVALVAPALTSTRGQRQG